MLNDERFDKRIMDEVAVAVVVILILMVGAAAGWAARSVSSRDKALISSFERSIAERDYYSAQIKKMVKEGEK